MIRIVFENKDLLIVDKPPGLQTEPDRNNHPNLLDECSKFYSLKNSSSLYLINRLDRPTGGLVILSKKKSKCALWQEAWNTPSIKKYYHAVVKGNVDIKEQTLDHFLLKDYKNFKAIIANEKLSDQYKECRLHYRVIDQKNDYSFLEVELYTGRYHQIRAQLSYIGHPIWNDVLYGAEPTHFEKIIGLYCTKLSLDVPNLHIGEYTAYPTNHPAYKIFNEVKGVID